MLGQNGWIMSEKNKFYFGDNLDVLRRYVADESVDLEYLDPPFKSNQNYNVLFKEQDGSRAASQIRAFEDTWTWDEEDEAVFADLAMAGGKVADVMQAFRTFLGPCDMLAYLVMMAPRLVELRRVLKRTGSIYLHCDTSAGAYLRLLMDAIFGPDRFLSEIIWKRTSAHSSAKRYGPVHDVILFYGKSEAYMWNPDYQPYDTEYVETFFEQIDPDGRRWKRGDLTGPGTRTGECGQTWRGINVNAKGRHWQPASYLYDKYRKMTGEDLAKYPLLERFDKLDALGLIHWPDKKGGTPRYKCYLEDMPGVPLQDVWTDVRPIHNLAEERLGYPTQKPQALLERIITASSKEGDLVLDPFCGCGTTVAAAQKLNRRWIGIDITHLAITLMKERIKDAFGESAQFEVVGEPVSVPDAAALAASDPYQFQWWALGLVGARPVEGKKGADKGIDGKIVFQGEGAGKFETVILSVKAGHVTVNQVRDLRGVVEREKAALGVLISMEDSTGPMRTETATAGFYESKMWNRRYPKIQLLTVADLLAGKTIDMPPVRQVGATFKKAPKSKHGGADQLALSEQEE